MPAIQSIDIILAPGICFNASDAGVTRHFWEATEVHRPIRGTKADSGRANIVWETDDVGFVEATYTVHPQPYGQLISQRRDGDSSFYHFDPLGNCGALTDDTQTQTDVRV